MNPLYHRNRKVVATFEKKTKVFFIHDDNTNSTRDKKQQLVKKSLTNKSQHEMIVNRKGKTNDRK